jgi:hypothetical protein
MKTIIPKRNAQIVFSVVGECSKPFGKILPFSIETNISPKKMKILR